MPLISYAYILEGIFRACWLDDKFIKYFGFPVCIIGVVKIIPNGMPSSLVTKQNVFFYNKYDLRLLQPTTIHFSAAVTRHVEIVPKLTNLQWNRSCAVEDLGQRYVYLISDSVMRWTGEQSTFSIWFWINNTQQQAVFKTTTTTQATARNFGVFLLVDHLMWFEIYTRIRIVIDFECYYL